MQSQINSKQVVTEGKGVNKLVIVIFVIALVIGGLVAAYKYWLTADDFLDWAMEEYKAGDYEEALDDIQEAIKRGVAAEDLDMAYKILGAIYDEKGEYELAIEAYEKGLVANPQNEQLWTNLGVSLRADGELERAEEAYLKALEINPGYAEAYSSLGTLAIVNEEPQEAIEYFEKALERDKSLAVTWGNKALAEAMVGNFTQADKDLKQATALGYENSAEILRRIENLKRQK